MLPDPSRVLSQTQFQIFVQRPLLIPLATLQLASAWPHLECVPLNNGVTRPCSVSVGPILGK